MITIVTHASTVWVKASMAMDKYFRCPEWEAFEEILFTELIAKNFQEMLISPNHMYDLKHEAN